MFFSMMTTTTMTTSHTSTTVEKKLNAMNDITMYDGGGMTGGGGIRDYFLIATIWVGKKVVGEEDELSSFSILFNDVVLFQMEQNHIK